MKAGIITHYDVHNHGAHLQLYALVQQLKQLGYEAKALQYIKNYDFIGGAQASKKYNISIRSLPFYFTYLLKNGFSKTFYNYRKRSTLSNFRRERRLVGAYYSEAEDIDLVVIGSDEIFSIEAGPNPCFYGIGVPCKKQIAYAASFGPTTLQLINEHNVGMLVEGGLKNICAITVRDRNSSEIVKHYTGKDVPIVCDPVLLHGFSEQVNDREFKLKQTRKYCIVYSYDNNMNDDATIMSIKDYASRHDLSVYSIGFFHKWCDRNIELSPLDVFKWFANADMIFTDTFHGSVISLVSGAQFIAKIRGNANKLAFLLEQYGVSERRVNDFGDIEGIVSKPINYSDVNERIVEIRKSSLDHLINAINA